MFDFGDNIVRFKWNHRACLELVPSIRGRAVRVISNNSECLSAVAKKLIKPDCNIRKRGCKCEMSYESGYLEVAARNRANPVPVPDRILARARGSFSSSPAAVTRADTCIVLRFLRPFCFYKTDPCPDLLRALQSVSIRVNAADRGRPVLLPSRKLYYSVVSIKRFAFR